MEKIYSDSYDNSAELEKKFAVINKTSVVTDMEKKIQNRLLNGFENWNRGFDAWKAWGDILYTEDSIYNVNGARLTLAEYQAAMDVILSKINLLMGDFHNMIICDDWTAIHYGVTKNGVPNNVMEFVNFKDYGDELGTRVVEGWGGTKDDSYLGMSRYMGPEEKAVEAQKNAAILSYNIPDTSDLNTKYPVMNPVSSHSAHAQEIRESVLQFFDSLNNGNTAFSACLDSLFAPDATIVDTKENTLTVDEYKQAYKEERTQTISTGLYFDSLLISDNWAAIHYPVVHENVLTGEKSTGDRMQFLRFAGEAGSLKIDTVYTK